MMYSKFNMSHGVMYACTKMLRHVLMHVCLYLCLCICHIRVNHGMFVRACICRLGWVCMFIDVNVCAYAGL